MLRSFLLLLPWYRKSLTKTLKTFDKAISDLQELVDQNNEVTHKNLAEISKLEIKVDTLRSTNVTIHRESERAEQIAEKISELLG